MSLLMTIWHTVSAFHSKYVIYSLILLMQFDTTNTYFSLASELVNYTSKNIFLTGKAGTGKTTFLKYIKESCPKQLAVVAPTGVAAINAGGTTIHSFFQLPLSPFVPAGGFFTNSGDVNNSSSLIGKMKVNNEKRDIFRALELLIIDEISMVRCDVLDAIDTVLRSFRSRYSEPFGGVQVLLIGDMHQLPPVAGDKEWDILSQFYSAPYFFSSKAIQQSAPLYISFEKIYRQSDEKFIQLLNQVRNNELDEDGMAILDGLYNPIFQPSKEEGYITLTTHNNKADKINEGELKRLLSAEESFKATVEGEFYERAYPADETLKLKIGAQVMFIKNDSEKVRRYFNGKIGTVTKIGDDTISVQCKDEAGVIEVSKEKWENIRYALNKQSQQIEEEIVGSFIQYPLRLAWAITIHKSQGLTFEKAVIDAGYAFSPGQVYVALSRCTALQGIVLLSRINYSSIQNDERIRQFSKNISSEEEIIYQLGEAKRNHQQSIIRSLFHFEVLTESSEEMGKLLAENLSSFNPDALDWFAGITDRIKQLNDVGYKFLPQLESFLQQPGLPQDNTALQERLCAASKYFESSLKALEDTIKQPSISTDNRELSKKATELLSQLITFLSERAYQFSLCISGFDASTWYIKKKEFKLQAVKINTYGGSIIYRSIAHPVLYQQLKQLRDEICERTYKPIYMVASSKTLEEICQYLPQNLHELGQISGFGKIRLKEVGPQFLKIICEYCDEKQLSSSISQKEKKVRKEKKEKGINAR